MFDRYVDEAAAALTAEDEQKAVDLATQRQFDEAHVVYLFPQPLAYVIDKTLTWTARPEGWIRPQDFDRA